MPKWKPKKIPLPPGYVEHMRKVANDFLHGGDEDLANDPTAFDCKGCRAWTSGKELDRGDGYCDRCVAKLASREDRPKVLHTVQREQNGGASVRLGFTRTTDEDATGPDDSDGGDSA